MSGTIPRVIKYGYESYQVKGNVSSARCKFCAEQTNISDKVGTTSNFVKHLQRLHTER